jgi:ABC-type multidrug transport system ATPase subunit
MLEGASLWHSLIAIGRDRRLAAARQVAMSAAEILGVADQALKPANSLPYGLKRRVEVTRALATAPRLMLLDEPAAGLNEGEQRDLASRIRQIANAGVTVLVIEHNLVFLRALAERLICLDRGRIIAAGTPEEVQADRAVVEAYLGSEEEGIDWPAVETSPQHNIPGAIALTNAVGEASESLPVSCRNKAECKVSSGSLSATGQWSHCAKYRLLSSKASRSP